MKTFDQLKDAVADLIQNNDATYKSGKVAFWVNLAKREVEDRGQWEELSKQFTITTSASRENYSLPYDYDKAIVIRDTTNDRVLIRESEEEAFDLDPTPSNGAPEYYRILDNLALTEQPASASTLIFRSTNGNDTSQNVRIYGNKDNIDITETVSLNGSSTAQSTELLDEFTQISLDASAQGTIEIVVSGSSTGGNIPSGRLASIYRQIAFRPIPAGAYTIKGRHKKRTRDLLNDADMPEIDADDAIILRAYFYALMEEGQHAKAALVDQQANRTIARIINSRGIGRDRNYSMTLNVPDRE